MNCLEWHGPALRKLVLDKARLPHALLLRGPRGVGKLAFARALAQSLLCEAPVQDGGACGECSGCSWLETGAHPDYRQIEPEGEKGDAEDGQKKSLAISVDQIRALPEFINMSSHRGGPKVALVHPAEALNINAANALLKSLEEPPPRTYFLLVTHRPHQLLPTIRSRCQHVTLAAPAPDEAAAWLAQQGVHEPAVALAHAGYAPLLALEIDKAEYWGARAAFMRHITARDLDVMSAAEAVRDIPIAQVIDWLQKWSYDLAHFQALQSVRYNPDHAEAAARTAASIDCMSTVRFHREMVKLQRVAQHPLNSRLFIEDLLLAYRELLGLSETVPA